MASFVFVLSGLVVAGVVLWSFIQTYNHNPPAHFIRVWGQLVLYYLAPTMPWWAFLVIVLAVDETLSVPISVLLLALIALYFYSAFVVQRQIAVHYLDVAVKATLGKGTEPRRIAVVANLWLGLFSNPKQFVRLVDTVNQLDVDAVVIIGEWLYNPPADLVGNLMQLRAINKPIYAIQGEHDHRYYTENADQFLHEDDLNHVFESTGIIEVNGLTPSNFDCAFTAHLPTPIDNIEWIKHSKNQPLIQLTNTLKGINANLTVPNDGKNNDKLDTNPLAMLLIAPDKSEVSAGYHKFKASDSTGLPPELRQILKIIPSFGQRGVPFRLSKPSITVITLNPN